MYVCINMGEQLAEMHLVLNVHVSVYVSVVLFLNLLMEMK